MILIWAESSFFGLDFVGSVTEDREEFHLKLQFAWGGPTLPGRPKGDHIDKPRLPATIEEARAPDILQWAQQQLNSGKSWEFIRTELGLGPADEDRRWREMRRHLTALEMPPTEDGSLIDLYQKQIAFQEKMMSLLRVIDERVKDGPRDRVIESKRGKQTVIRDTTYHHFVKMNMELLEKMMKHNQTNFESFVTVKQSKTGKRSGVKINIYSNVPRPEKPTVEIIEDE